MSCTGRPRMPPRPFTSSAHICRATRADLPPPASGPESAMPKPILIGGASAALATRGADIKSAASELASVLIRSLSLRYIGLFLRVCAVGTACYDFSTSRRTLAGACKFVATTIGARSEENNHLRHFNRWVDLDQAVRSVREPEARA